MCTHTHTQAALREPAASKPAAKASTRWPAGRWLAVRWLLPVPIFWGCGLRSGSKRFETRGSVGFERVLLRLARGARYLATCYRPRCPMSAQISIGRSMWRVMRRRQGGASLGTSGRSSRWILPWEMGVPVGFGFGWEAVSTRAVKGGKGIAISRCPFPSWASLGPSRHTRGSRWSRGGRTTMVQFSTR